MNSSLVVEFIVLEIRIGSLEGDSARTRTGNRDQPGDRETYAPMDAIEKDFAAYARERAEKLAPGLDSKNRNSAGHPVLLLAKSAPIVVIHLLKRDSRRLLQVGAIKLREAAITEWITATPQTFMRSASKHAG